MNATAAAVGTGERPGAGLPALLLLLPAGAWFATRHEPRWGVMAALALTEFGALKLATLGTAWRTSPPARVAAYLFLYPGLNARAFLQAPDPRNRTTARALDWPVANLAIGTLALGWATARVDTAPPLLAGWAAMVGLIFLLHFGAFSLVSILWCRQGLTAPPIMRAPIASTSVVEFWSRRWNLAFADCARRMVFRPVARRLGALWAGATVFLVSGLVHETVISLPAQGGWGGPTLYFLLQALGIQVERSAPGRRLGLAHGRRGWGWTLLVTAVPLPLLFHPAFVTRVIVPPLHGLRTLLP